MGKLKELYMENLERMDEQLDRGEMVTGINDQIVDALTTHPLTQTQNVL